jgi:hypothetical protein
MKTSNCALVGVKPSAYFSTETIFTSYTFKFNCSNIKHTATPAQKDLVPTSIHALKLFITVF